MIPPTPGGGWLGKRRHGPFGKEKSFVPNGPACLPRASSPSPRGRRRLWSLTANRTVGVGPRHAITAATPSLAALIFAGSDLGIDITGEPGAVQRSRQLISTLATVVNPV
jgi:hypothetical protein